MSNNIKVAVLGHFGAGKNLSNGQTIKTKIITEELSEQLGDENVLKIDTHGGIKTLLLSPLHTIKALKSARNVIIFPAHNGLRVYAPLLSFYGRLFKNRKIHYIVIGGWLPQFLIKRKSLTRTLKKFDGIYVETNAMKKALDAQGFENVFVMPNCKKLTALSENELVYQSSAPYKLCTFSRVMKEKGIEDAVCAVNRVNKKYNHTIFSLDIYGQIDNEQVKWFDELSDNFNNNIKYCGIVPFDKTTMILKNYYALLFPTFYEGEGLAGTLIDAKAAGIPIIASDWKYNTEVVLDGINGYIYPTGDVGELEKKLIYIYENMDEWNEKKIYSLLDAKKYDVTQAVDIIVSRLV